MVEASYGTIAKLALTRQAIATEAIKSSLDNQKAVANVIDQAARSIQANATRGTNFNTRV